MTISITYSDHFNNLLVCLTKLFLKVNIEYIYNYTIFFTKL